MRKPELFKMACLRDIQRLFGGSRSAFYAGFGNRITDAMSYRSVNVPSSRIFTIDSYGEVKMELLELAGYKSSYIHMVISCKSLDPGFSNLLTRYFDLQTDLVDQMFPPVHREVIPEYTDFNYWRPAIPDIAIPDLTPPQPVSPALSATSDTSGRLSMLGRLTGIARRASRQTITGSTDDGRKATSASSRPSSPLSHPADDGSDYGYDEDAISDRGEFLHDSRPSSMPGSFEDKGEYLGDEFFDQRGFQRYKEAQHDQRGRSPDVDLGSNHDHDDRYQHESEDDDVYPEMFDDDLLATGEMSKVPY
jgi:phosphatidate phosphatase LPIN